MLKSMISVCATALVFICAGSTIATADQLDEINDRGTLICGVLTGAKPFGFQDPTTRETVGYDIDFCKGVAQRLGVDIELKTISAEARIPQIQQRGVDIAAAALGYTEQRAKQIGYTKTYFAGNQVIIADVAAGYTKLSDFDGKKISLPKGSNSEQLIRAQIPGAQMVTFQDPPSAFLAFAQRKVAGMALTDVALQPFRANAPFEFVVVPETLSTNKWGLGLAKGETRLQEAVNTALVEMEESGEAAAIFEKWFGKATDYKLARTFMVSPITE